VATVSLVILACKTTAMPCHERNSCHTPYLAILKWQEKLMCGRVQHWAVLYVLCFVRAPGFLGEMTK